MINIQLTTEELAALKFALDGDLETVLNDAEHPVEEIKMLQALSDKLNEVKPKRNWRI